MDKIRFIAFNIFTIVLVIYILGWFVTLDYDWIIIIVKNNENRFGTAFSFIVAIMVYSDIYKSKRK